MMRLSERDDKIQFLTMVFGVLLLVGLLVACGDDEPRAPLKFKVGQMIQTKIGQQVGQIITTWSVGSYTIRFERKDSENGTLFDTEIMKEFELEKFDGERR